MPMTMTDTSLSPLTPEAVTALFTRADGQFLFARWGRPIVPVVFGVEDGTVSILKGAIEAVVALAGHKMAETDQELGANLMVFFIRDWAELTATPNLDRLIPDLAPLVARLEGADANQYRAFRFDEGGGIKAAFVFIRMDAAMAQAPAETIALSQIGIFVINADGPAMGHCIRPKRAAMRKPNAGSVDATGSAGS
jgi:hypothetical protein